MVKLDELGTLFHLRDYAGAYILPKEKQQALLEIYNSMHVALRAYCFLNGIEYHERDTYEDVAKRLHDGQEHPVERE